MADTTILPTGGMQSNGGGPNWLLIGGAGVGILVVLYLMTKSGGSAGQPTTAAGSSINAALGSVQEQNLNLMGQLGNVSNEISTNDAALASELNLLQGGETYLGNTIGANQQSNLAASTYLGNQLGIVQQLLAALGWKSGADTAASSDVSPASPFPRETWITGGDTATSTSYAPSPYAKV